MKQYSFINHTLSASPRKLHSHTHQDAFFSLVQKFKVTCPHAVESEIRKVIARIISELNASPEFDDFLPMKPLWPQEPLTQDFNPDHYPKGSSNGGQFAPKDEHGLSISILPQNSLELKKPERKTIKNATPDVRHSHNEQEQTYQGQFYGFSPHHEIDLHTFFDRSYGVFQAGSPEWLRSHERDQWQSYNRETCR